MIRYDTIEEFNVDSKAVRDQLNVAQKLKQTNAGAHLVKYRLRSDDREVSPEGIRRLWRKGL